MNDLIHPNNMSNQNQIGSHDRPKKTNSKIYRKAQLPTTNEYQYAQSLEIMRCLTQNQQKGQQKP